MPLALQSRQTANEAGLAKNCLGDGRTGKNKDSNEGKISIKSRHGDFGNL